MGIWVSLPSPWLWWRQVCYTEGHGVCLAVKATGSEEGVLQVAEIRVGGVHVEGGSVRGRTNRVLPMQIVNRCRRSLPSLTTPLPDSCLCAPSPLRYCCVPATAVFLILMFLRIYSFLTSTVFWEWLYSCNFYTPVISTFRLPLFVCVSARSPSNVPSFTAQG